MVAVAVAEPHAFLRNISVDVLSALDAMETAHHALVVPVLQVAALPGLRPVT